MALAPVLGRIFNPRAPSPPWDDTAAIREVLFSVERMEEHARSLALTQIVKPQLQLRHPLLDRVAANEASLIASYRSVCAAVDDKAAITPAAEWLIDNFHLVERQIREVRLDLPPRYYRQLPKLASGPFAGLPRVFELVWAFVAHTDSRFDVETWCAEVKVDNPRGVSKGVASARLDGIEVDNRPVSFDLPDDGQSHEILVVMGDRRG